LEEPTFYKEISPLFPWENHIVEIA
jgi:hypothetical protein